jgi:hypothetical protein
VFFLRRTLVLGAHVDLKLEPCWIASETNRMADALSRFDNEKVAKIAPQLKLP